MSLRTIKAMVPWRVKIVAKLLLSRVPLGYGLWRRLELFRHGQMTDPRYAEGVFADHAVVLATLNRPAPVLLELGPGDSLLSVLLGYRLGAARTILVDAGAYAVEDPTFYHRAAAALGVQAGPWVTSATMLAECRGSYLTDGLASLRTIPSASVDFIWSQAVLEHVRRAEYASVARELHRVLRPDGAMSHLIDFKDHLGGRLNSLRFSPGTWESPLFSRSGFYTNRLRLGDAIRLFEEAGFSVEVPKRNAWEVLPTPRAVMDPSFRALPDADLLVAEAHLVMRPR